MCSRCNKTPIRNVNLTFDARVASFQVDVQVPPAWILQVRLDVDRSDVTLTLTTARAVHVADGIHPAANLVVNGDTVPHAHST